MAVQCPNILLLQASVDPEDASEFRLLVDNKSVKYITIDAGVYDCRDMCFGPALISLLPPLPPGDWNKGRISRSPKTGDAYFSAFSKAHLPGITKTWHSTRIDYLDLREGRKIRPNVYEVNCPGFNSTIIAKFARFEWEVPQLEAETVAYSWIEGHQVGPAFLGHLTEEGRVIGFLLGRVTDYRYATPEDFPLCHSALSKLHNFGIKHGDVNKHNFLIHDGRATLIDFDNASRLASVDELEVELRELQGQLWDTSGSEGQVVERGPH